MKSILLSLVFGFVTVIASAQNQPQLIKDITPGEANSDITELVPIGDIVFFIAPDGTNGFQLWRTDGTESGTYVVKVINPGITGMYTYIVSLTNVNGTLFFLADDGVHGAEFWKSDGTETGTVMIKDINPGAGDFINVGALDGDYLAVIGDILYFTASGTSNDNELWRSDGTETGTYRVRDILPGTTGSNPVLLTNAGGILYFQCENSNGDYEVWKSDGTENGTVFLKSVAYVGYTDGDGANFFIEYNGYVYFTAAEVLYDEELFRSDGTPSGTGLFMDLNPLEGSNPRAFYILNNKLIFFAEVANESHFFTSDGTINGTQVLNDNSGNAAVVGSAGSSGSKMLYTGDKLYYVGESDSTHTLSITDGTPSGTFEIAYLELGFSTNQTAIGNSMVFRSDDENNGCYTLYETNGTSSGTTKSFECDIVTPNNFLVTLGNKVIFMGTSDNEGREIWSYQPSFPSGIETLPPASIEVFPNPSTTGVFQFSIPQAVANANANAYDVLGRKIFATSENASSTLHSIDLSLFPKGIYFLEIKNEQQRIISKLLYE